MRIHNAGIVTASVLALITTSLATAPSAAAQAPQGQRFGANYLLPPVSAVRARDVPGLAVNPQNPNHIVEAEMDPINLQCDYHVSFDGGRTWTGGHLTVRKSGENPPFPTPACSQNFDSGGYHHFNTGIVFGSAQNVYVTFSVHRGEFNRPESAIKGGFGDEAVVARSTDGGRTFQPAVVAIQGGGPVGDTNLAGYGMRPQIAVERGAGNNGQDRLYVASWNCFTTGGCSGGAVLPRRIYMARSDNGGATWTDRVLVSQPNVHDATQAAAIQTQDEQAREPSEPIVGPDGTVYMAYRNRDAADGTSSCPPNPFFSNQRRNCFVVARSTDQGQTWQQFSTGVPICGGPVDEPRLAMDPSTPAGVGTLYITYYMPNCPTTSDLDIRVQRSTNRGQDWSAPVRVNDDGPSNPAPVNSQTNPDIAVGPTGEVDVTWSDRRHTYPGPSAAGTFPGPVHVDIYSARSTNGGASFGANHRVTDRHINVAVGRMGDFGTYTWYGPVATALPNGSSLTAWPDSRLGNVDTGYQDIFLSRMNPSAGIERTTIRTATPSGLSTRLSQRAYPGGNEALAPQTPVTRVVVANQNDPAAALAGAVLARANWGPLLLSPSSSLPAFAKAEAARIRPEGAYVIGDRTQLQSAVGSALTDTTRDGENVVRVQAPQTMTVNDRPAEIARRIAELMRPLQGTSPEAVVVNPRAPEAPAAAALAAAQRLPLLYVDNLYVNNNPVRPASRPVPAPTEQAITELGIKRLLLVGRPGATPSDPEALTSTVETRLTAGGTGFTGLGAANVSRISGADALATSDAVLGEARTRGLPQNVLYVSDPTRPTEGAALAAASARLGGLTLISPGADPANAEGRLPGSLTPLLDRIVAAIGTGGADPAVAAPRPQTPIGYPLPPANLALAGCPPVRAARTLITLSNAGDRRNGTPGNDLIFAGAGDDVIDALGGNDCVDLGPGRDRGEGSGGNDFLVGGLGDDVVSGSRGNDHLRGNSGNDRIVAGTGNDRVLGGTGLDRIVAGTGNDRVLGGTGLDRIVAGTGNDRVLGGTGLDRIFGNFGNDVLNGEAGRDQIQGSRGRDRINGGAGNDRISGGSSADRVAGDQGNDRISGGSGRDVLKGHSGRDRIAARDRTRDRIDCGTGRDRVVADRIDVVARNCERVRRR